MTKAVDPKIRISGLSLLAIQQKIFDIQIYNPLTTFAKSIFSFATSLLTMFLFLSLSQLFITLIKILKKIINTFTVKEFKILRIVYTIIHAL